MPRPPEEQRLVAGILLAAGLSTRMGRSKPLLAYGGGTVVEHILSVLTFCPIQEIVVVTGHAREAVEPLLARWPVRSVFNPEYATGQMLASVQTGLRAVSKEASAALIALCDQPTVERAVVEQILDAYRVGLGSLVIPSFQMKRGHPVLIDRKHWEGILALEAGRSLRDFIRGLNADEIRHVEVDTPSILQDLDTMEDYRGLASPN